MTTPALHALRCRRAATASHAARLACRRGRSTSSRRCGRRIEYDAPWVKQDAPIDFHRDLAMRDRLAAGNFDAAVIFTVYSQNPLPAAMLCHLSGIGSVSHIAARTRMAC